MGRTGKVAVDKKDVEPAAPGGVQRTPVPVSSGVASNEIATFVPSAGKLEKPRRLSKIELPYPSLLMARGVEGDVVVRIHILDNGTVAKVDVVRGSGHEEFDAAARGAALRERFSPARRKGEPVDYVLEYTYRFRLKQA
jgi:TonB family protein